MIRMLLKNWKLNSIAVVSLAIALALGVVALSVSDAILLRPPYARDPGRLVIIFTSSKPGEVNQMSFPDYRYLRDHARSFTSMAAYGAGVSKGNVTFNGREEMAMENTVSDNYFEVMGIHPFLGRLFHPGDDSSHTRAAVLSYAYWKRSGADPKIAGKSIKIGSDLLPIIGVAPKEFLSPIFGFASDIVLNLAGSGDLTDRERRSVMPVGRLKPDAGLGQAGAEISALWAQLAHEYPKTDKDRTTGVAPISVLSPDELKDARLISAVLIACSLLILLIACANTANLLLALATLRRQEALIKTALGASRARLIREFLQETGVVCLAGGLIGWALASIVLNRLSHFDLNLPAFGVIPIAADLHPGFLVAVLTLALVIVASLASGLAPALYASKTNLAGALTGEIAIGGTRRGWIRGIVVTVQVAVCTLVLAGTGLCWQSLHNLRNVDPGFSARNLAAILIFPAPESDFSEDHAIQLYDDIRRDVGAIHGVQSAALIDDLPLGGGNGNQDDVHFADRPDDPARKNTIGYSVVDENYFSTLGIPVLEGRVFRPSDRKTSPFVVVINRLMAEKYWPHQSAVGRAIRITSNRINGGKGLATIIGVVANGKYGDLDEPYQPFLYHSLKQDYRPVATMVARTAGDPRLWFAPMMAAIRKLGFPLYLPPTTMDSWMNLTLFVPLLTLGCVAGISILAMLLATAGLYGAISYSVSDRRKELGIRIALGARPSQVLQMIFRQTLWIAGAGVLAGLALSVLAGFLFADQFYQVHPVEWNVLVLVGLGMVAVCLAIAFAAARRWTRMNPMDAVRHV